MNEFVDSRTRAWALAAVIAGIGLFIGLELLEEPDLAPLELFLELLSITPVVLTSVGVVLLFRVTQRHREEHLQVIRDLEVARVQGQRWRSESRSLLDGLGAAIEIQFSRWNLTEAEREVALLLLKGLSSKEIAQVSRCQRAYCPRTRAGYLRQGRPDRPRRTFGFFSRGFACSDRRGEMKRSG